MEDPKKKTFAQFIRYCVVGGSGAILNLILLYLFTEYVFGSSFWFVPGYIASAVVTTLIVFVWNFWGNKTWTFIDKPTSHPFSILERVFRRILRR